MLLQLFLAGALTAIDAVADYPVTEAAGRYKLGQLAFSVDDTYGIRVWRYVYNNSGSSIAANLGVMQENGTDFCQVSLSTTGIAAQRIYGVTAHAIPDLSCGWVVCDGLVYAASDGSTTADTPQKPAASGQFTDGVVGTDSIVGHALETENPAGAAGLFRMLVRFL